MSDYETILLDIDARGIATVTLNRPDKHNAMNAQMIRELDAVAAQLAGEETVRAVVLAGAGQSFCAGGDLNWMKAQAEQDRSGKIAEARALAGMLAAWNALPKPVVARVHGRAYGGGIGLIAVSDVAIAAEGLRFSLTETRLGLIPATIGPFVVSRMGAGFARQVFFSGATFDVDFGLRSGFLARACAPADLDAAVEMECSAILKCAPGAVADAKALCRTLARQPEGDVLTMTAEALADRWETSEAQDGIAAFFAREAPPWRDEF
ncbi:crotonase/enoyl-CoA hydratase family protein [Oricola sp.]|uniref:crotonase/enoyl-CoA hydratase family protein n=1 Tax=Oricola sp. TaxID=1979950 RepID=UPI003BA94F1F